MNNNFTPNSQKVELFVHQLNEGINKVWHSHTMEYNSSFNMKEALMHTRTGMRLKNVMLSERRQSQKNTYCMISCIWNAHNSEPIETQNRLVFAYGGEWGKREWLVMRWYLFMGMKNFVNFTYCAICITLNILKITDSYTKQVNFVCCKLYLNRAV